MAAPFLTKQSKTLFELVPEIGIERGSGDSIIDEQFPHIKEKLLLLWGSRECMEYLQSLIEYSVSTDRSGRQGFPFHAVVELNIIRRVHHRDFSHEDTTFAMRQNDIWNPGRKDGN